MEIMLYVGNAERAEEKTIILCFYLNLIWLDVTYQPLAPSLAIYQPFV